MLPFIFGRIIVIETFIRVRGATVLHPVFPNIRKESAQRIPRGSNRRRLVPGGH